MGSLIRKIICTRAEILEILYIFFIQRVFPAQRS